MNSKQFIIGLSLCFTSLISSGQHGIDTIRITIDSLRFWTHVACSNEQNSLCDTTYGIENTLVAKNGFNSYFDKDINRDKGYKHKTKEEFELIKKEYQASHKCLADIWEHQYPLNSYFYLKMSFVNSFCDSVTILEGLFYCCHKLELYHAGIYKEYDDKGQLEVEGNYIFSSKGKRSATEEKQGSFMVRKYGDPPLGYKGADYGGCFVRAKKDGEWKYYKNRKLRLVETFKKGKQHK